MILPVLIITRSELEISEGCCVQRSFGLPVFAVLGLFLNFGDKYMNRFSEPVSTYDDDVECFRKGLSMTLTWHLL